MVRYPPPKYPRRSRRKGRITTERPAAPAALTLVSANYAEGQWVELGFDRAIDISSIVVTAITIDDGPISGSIWRGTGLASLTNATTVRVPVSEFDTTSDPETVLNATAGTGIVAVDDGGTWAGVTGLPFPFPE